MSGGGGGRRTGRRGSRREGGGRRRSGRSLWSPGPGRTPGPGSAPGGEGTQTGQDQPGNMDFTFISTNILNLFTVQFFLVYINIHLQYTIILHQDLQKH